MRTFALNLGRTQCYSGNHAPRLCPHVPAVAVRPISETARISTSQTVYADWLQVFRVTLTQAGQSLGVRHVEDHGDAAVVLPFDAARRVATVISMPRSSLLHRGENMRILECPAGLIDPGETPEQAARREAFEEVGLRLDALELVVDCWTMPGVSTERSCLYVAPYSLADRGGPGGGLADENEMIESYEISLADLRDAALRGQIPDLKLLVLVLYLMATRPLLFTGGPDGPPQEPCPPD